MFASLSRSRIGRMVSIARATATADAADVRTHCPLFSPVGVARFAASRFFGRHEIGNNFETSLTRHTVIECIGRAGRMARLTVFLLLSHTQHTYFLCVSAC